MSKSSGAKDFVVAFFDDVDEGEAAARRLALEGILEQAEGTIGLLTLDAQGKVRSSRLGDRVSEHGPEVGSVLGSIALAITGGVLPKRGRFFDSRSNLTTDDIARFGAHLDAGQALVAVLCRHGSATDAIVALTQLGGKTEAHRLTGRALWRAAATPVP